MPDLRLSLFGVLSCFLGACSPTGIIEPADDLLDVTLFVRDQPAIADRWYDYDSETHVVIPAAKTFVFSIEDENGYTYVGLRVRSYYNPDTAASGWFSFEIARYGDDGAWDVPVVWNAPHSVRTDGPVCINLVDMEAVDCGQDGWHLQARVFPLLVAEAGLVVGNPGLFVHSVDGIDAKPRVMVSTQNDVPLEALPHPNSMKTLSNELERDLGWDRLQLAPNLPSAGMALGYDLTADQVHFLLTPRRSLERFTISIEDERIHIQFSSAELNDSGDGYGEFSTTGEIDVRAPADGELVYIALNDDKPVPFGIGLAVSDQLLPPDEREWDLAVERVSGQLRATLSPSCAVRTQTLDGKALHEAFPAFDENQ